MGVQADPARAAPSIAPRVVVEHPHDSRAFTQGLVHHGGVFYESTGLRGSSTLRRVEPTTGVVTRSIDLDASEFGEGLARVDDRLIQLTWQEGVAHVYDLSTFEPQGSFAYQGEGWGLCYDGERLVMSDGSDQLFFRDPISFEVVGAMSVVDEGEPVFQLNELECVDGVVLANVWMTENIVVIDPDTGVVLQQIDASGLLTPEEAASADVLNGIARDETSGRYYLTGKLWPKLFEVELDVAKPPGKMPATQPARGGSCAMCAIGQTSPGAPEFALWALLLVVTRRCFSRPDARFRGALRRTRFARRRCRGDSRAPRAPRCYRRLSS